MLQEIRRDNHILFARFRNPVGIAGIDGRIEQVNEAWLQSFGYSQEALKAKPFIELVHPDDQEKSSAALARVEPGTPVVTLENHCRRADGSYRWFLWDISQATPGGPLYLVGQDITEAREAENQFARRATALETVAKVSAAAAQILDIETLLQTVSDLAKESFGLYHAHIYLLDTDGQRLILSGGAGEVGRLMKAQKRRIALNNTQSLVARAARTLQGVMENDVTEAVAFLPNPLLPETRSELAVPMRVGDALIGVLDVQSSEPGYFTDEDVRVQTALADQIAVAVQNAQAFQTTRRLNEDLAQRESQFRSMVENVPGVIYRCAMDALWTMYFISPAIETLVGYPAEEFIRNRVRSYASIIHPEDSAMVDTLIVEAVNKRQAYQIEYRVIHPEQGIRWVAEHGQAVYDKSGSPLWLDGAIIDITEREAFKHEIERRARELETVAKVSTAIANILDIETLLQTVSDLAKERFGLYHAHIYLLDTDGQRLILSGGAGEVGRLMKAQKRRIALNNTQSLVARAARTLQGVMENDVTEAAAFLPNPMLPDTRSELAVPMLVGGTLIGVLDVQSNKAGYFTGEDVRIQTALADQIAVAVQNARTFDEIEKARFNLRERIKELTALQYIGALADKRYDEADYLANAIARIPVSMLYPEDCVAAVELEGKVYGDPRALETVTRLQHPILLEDMPAGRLVVGYLVPRDFLPEETPHIEAVAERIQGYLAIRRAEAQIQRRARELETVAKVSTAIANILDIETLLQTVSDLAKESFGLYHAHIYLLDTDGQRLILSGGAGEVGRLMKAQKRRIALNNTLSLVARAARALQGVMENDVAGADTFLPNPMLPDTRSELAVPMLVGGTLIGVLDVQSNKAGYFTDEDVRIQTALADQIAVAVQNARTFDEVGHARATLRQRAAEMETVAQVSAATAHILDVYTLLKTVADLTKDRFGLYHAHVYLLDDKGEYLVLEAGAGEVGRLMKEQRRRIAIGNLRSLVARAARNRKGVVENNVRGIIDFLPNPLLPDTQSEMAVPMVVGETLIGVLDVQSEFIERFSEEEVRVFTALTDQIAVAVQNAQLFQHQAETAEQLRTVDRLKSEFLASMSHELRTPLNSIIGYSEVLADGIDGELPEDAIEDVNAIHESGQHLLSMINDILDLAKIEAGRMELDFESVNLAEVADEVRRITSGLLKDKPIRLVVDVADGLPVLNADRVRLRQILNNLVGNAIKFTKQGEIRILARPLDASTRAGLNRQLQTPGEAVLIQVEDTGEGVDAEHLELIFERFRQADSSSTRKAGGTGMGLAITRHLIALHGGEIWVESALGAGSTFSFIIPVAQTV